MNLKRTMSSRDCLRAVEFRATTSDEPSDGRTLFGYAAVFGVTTEINSWEGMFEESIAPGAFKKTLREKTPVLQFDHGHDSRTGSVPIGKFTTLREDSEGLYVEAELFDNDIVEPIRQAIEGQAINGMSFRFQVVRDEWFDRDGKRVKAGEIYDLLWDAGDRGPLLRSIKEVKCLEAGPVVFPAYVQTSVGVRSLESLSEDERRKAIADEYQRTMDKDSDAVVESNTSEDDKTTDAVVTEEIRDDTSEGQKETVRRFVPRVVPDELPENYTRKGNVPMNLEELRARLAVIVERMRAIDDEHRGQVLSEELDTEFTGLQTEHTDVTAKIKAIEGRAAALKDLVVAGDVSVERGSDTGRRGPEVLIKKDKADLFDLEATRSLSTSAENFVELCRDNALRIAENMKVPGANRDKSRERAMELIEEHDTKHGDLAKRFMATSSDIYERAFGKAMMSLNTMGLTNEEQRALAVGADATGGFAVPAQLDPSIIYTDTLGVSPIRQIARVETITSSKWQGITSAGVTVSRDAEAEQVSDDSPTLARPEVVPGRVQGFVPFSIELDQDWPQLRGELSRMLARAKDKEENDYYVTGAGGVLTTLTGNTVAAASGATIVAGDVYAVENALAAQYRQGAAWVANKTIYNKIRQFDTQGGAQLWERIGAGTPSELLGYPAYEASAMASVTTNGTKMMILGNFAEGFIIVDRVGMSIELVPHLFGANGRPTGQRGVYAIWRNGSKVLVDAAFKVLVATT